MNNGHENQAQAEIRKAINEISQYAIRLYDLMETGMAVEVIFPEITAIITPGRPPKMRRLIIFKPHLHVTINTKP